jgi:hypothetical protein
LEVIWALDRIDNELVLQGMRAILPCDSFVAGTSARLLCEDIQILHHLRHRNSFMLFYGVEGDAVPFVEYILHPTYPEPENALECEDELPALMRVNLRLYLSFPEGMGDLAVSMLIPAALGYR